MPQQQTAQHSALSTQHSSVQRIGVLTGGGDCPGLNAVLRGLVKTAVGSYGWEVLGFEDGFDGLLDPERVQPLTLDAVRGILPRGGTILGTTNRSNPFDYVWKEHGAVRRADRSAEALARFAALSLDALVVVGGDGTLAIAERFYRLGVPVVGVPKTIDNDLSATDVTFGYQTALQTATEAIDRLHTTAESHHRVLVVEVMGRHAGWIAIESGLAGGADVILLPELPFDIDQVVIALAARQRRGRGFSIVVAAEGAAPRGGAPFVQPSADKTSPTRLGGIGAWLVAEIEARMEVEARAVVLGHLQRGGSPVAFDRVLGTRFGAAAARLIAAGGFGQMVALQTPRVVPVPLAEAVGALKRVPPDGELVQTARGLGIGFGD
ncbi:MAG TPA: ATP-dependent 6-phosphofructokinase [Chloroflexota bacterium]|nr:ATP-dependent 6-phosphofructokinase [Chloroflexota bacterium]